ncbi:MAG: 4Fe-4S dicluster domain-containing protein [Granulosicoccaceae bacterium]
MIKMNLEPPNPTNSLAARRRFLQRLGLLSVAVAAPALLPALSGATITPVKGASNKHRWGLLIDTSKCVSGCDACVRGCHEEHGINGTGNDHTDAQWIRKIDLQDDLTAKQSSLPMMCQHCDSAPCVDVCPTGASFKRADGVVLVNKHTCIGCRYCVMACPYKARSFIHEPVSNQKSWAPRGQGTVESCTLCVHRIDAEGEQQPACAVACTDEAHSAILFGDLSDPQSDIAKAMNKRHAQEVRSDLELNTGVRYLNL